MKLPRLREAALEDRYPQGTYASFGPDADGEILHFEDDDPIGWDMWGSWGRVSVFYMREETK